MIKKMFSQPYFTPRDYFLLFSSFFFPPKCPFFVKDLLTVLSLVSTVCNFMSHEKCLKNVKIPCSCIAPSLVRVSKHTLSCLFHGTTGQIYC